MVIFSPNIFSIKLKIINEYLYFESYALNMGANLNFFGLKKIFNK